MFFSILGNKEYAKVVGRKSPPASLSSGAASKHSAMLVRRSKSSAILPLRKHLIEKTLAEQQQKAAQDQDKLAASLKKRPIEEVMEEDILTSFNNRTGGGIGKAIVSY
jgi:hypothetical protein